MELFAMLNVIIFSVIGAFHAYWALGGKQIGTAVIPQTDGQKPLFNPGPVATIIVALGLFGFAAVHLMALGYSCFGLEHYTRFFLIIIAIIFLLRAIGDFNYVGFFKKKKSSDFAINDTKYYSPLCVLIFMNTIITIYL